MRLARSIVAQILSGEKTQMRRPITTNAPKVGSTLPVGIEGSEDPPECRVEVLSVRSEPLTALSKQDAKREGFKTPEAFYEAWRLAWEGDVWVIDFKLADPLRILARNPDSMEANYVDHPSLGIPGEPEAVDEFTQERISEQAHAKDRVINAELRLHREARSLSKQIREETLAAGRAGFDIAEHLEKIRAELREIRRKREAA